MANLKSLAKETAIYGMSSIVGRFLNYLLVPLYTAKLSAASGGYGVITNVYALTALMLVLLTYGMETGFFRFANKAEENPTRVYSTILISVFSTSLLFFLLVLGNLDSVAGFLGYADHPEYIGMMAAVVALDAFQSIPFARLRYQKKALKFAALKLLFIIMSIGLNLLYFVALPALYESHPEWISSFYNPGVGVGYAFGINLVCTASITVLFWPELTGFRYAFDYRLWRRILAYSFPILILGVAGILNQTVDKIIFPFVYDGTEQAARAQLGIYGAASKIAMIMAMLIQAFRFAYEPFVFGKAAEKDNRDTYAQAMKYFIIFSLMAFLAVVFYIDLLRYIIAPSYWDGLRVVPIVMTAETLHGHLLQPLLLVQAHRPDTLRCMVLTHRMHRHRTAQHPARPHLRLHGLCLGRRCRLRSLYAALLLHRTKEIPHPLRPAMHRPLHLTGRHPLFSLHPYPRRLGPLPPFGDQHPADGHLHSLHRQARLSPQPAPPHRQMVPINL